MWQQLHHFIKKISSACPKNQIHRGSYIMLTEYGHFTTSLISINITRTVSSCALKNNFSLMSLHTEKNYNLFVDAEDKLLPGNESKLSVPAITVFELKMQKKFNVFESVCANCAICIPSCRLTCLLPSWFDKSMEVRTNIKWRWSSHQQIVSRVCTESIIPVLIQI